MTVRKQHIIHAKWVGLTVLNCFWTGRELIGGLSDHKWVELPVNAKIIRNELLLVIVIDNQSILMY